MRVITDCVLENEKKSNCWLSEPSAKLSKADLMPVDNNNSDKRRVDWGRDHKEFEEEILKIKKTKTQRSVWETEPLSRTPLWKPPLGQNPPFWSHSTYIICLWNDTRQASNLHPPPSLVTTIPKSLDAGVKACTPTSVWAVIIWLGLCHIKPRPAKDSPEEKAERGREKERSAPPPTCAGQR